jgi:hypothetical protein
LAAYCVGTVESGQRCRWPLSTEPLGGGLALGGPDLTERAGSDRVCAVLSTLLVLASCTGTQVAVQPPVDSLPATFPNQFAAVGVREVTSDHVYGSAGNVVQGFSNELRTTGLASETYFPARPDDPVDVTLDTRIDVTVNQNTGSAMVKAFFTGLTMFLLEPAFWYHLDYKLVGHVDVLHGNRKLGELDADTDARMSMKFLSLSEQQTLEGETLGEAKKSLYRQLMDDLAKRVR